MDWVTFLATHLRKVQRKTQSRRDFCPPWLVDKCQGALQQNSLPYLLSSQWTVVYSCPPRIFLFLKIAPSLLLRRKELPSNRYLPWGPQAIVSSTHCSSRKNNEAIQKLPIRLTHLKATGITSGQRNGKLFSTLQHPCLGKQLSREGNLTIKS